jgi:hypothetical protein
VNEADVHYSSGGGVQNWCRYRIPCPRPGQSLEVLRKRRLASVAQSDQDGGQYLDVDRAKLSVDRGRRTPAGLAITLVARYPSVGPDLYWPGTEGRREQEDQRLQEVCPCVVALRAGDNGIVEQPTADTDFPRSGSM